MAEQSPEGPLDESPEHSPGVVEEVGRLAAELEAHPDPEVRERVVALLAGIDVIHRTALARLMDAIRRMAGDAFLNRLTADPAVRLLLMSYDLVAVDRRLLAEEALDAVRGHLAGHGVRVELLDVVGGAVYVRLGGLDHSGVDEELVRRDVEAALSAGLLGFQELVVGERAGPAPAVVSLGVRRASRPVYRDALRADDLAPGSLRAVDLDGTPVLLANVEGEFYAVGDHCGDSPLPLRFGALSGPELRCSWHGCRYDVRSGLRVDGVAGRLTVLPVAVEDGVVRVAVGVAPADEGASSDAERSAASAD